MGATWWEGPLHCFVCHSQVDWTAPVARVVEGTKGSGGPFLEEGLPFQLIVPNITPDRETGVGAWTDRELGRAIREGIGRDGRVLFPVMPYNNFRAMSDEDLAAVIAYLRSIEPVRRVQPKTEMPDFIRSTLKPPPPAGSVPAPDLSTPAKRGAYYVRLWNCNGCHTPVGPAMRPLPEIELAGGFVMKGPWGEVTSANITTDPSGISYYDENLFVRVMRTGHVGARRLNNIMLWSSFRNMTDGDLKAIFAYLRTLKPVSHRIDNTEPLTPCKRCGNRHGLGNLNG